MKESVLINKQNLNNSFNYLPVVISDINVLLQYVLNIVSSYKVDLNRIENLVRIDEFHKYDKNLVNKSIKDNRLLTLDDNNGTIFKNIYQYSYEEKIDTYENRFIKFFLSKLRDDLFYSYYSKKYEKMNFLSNNLTYGEYGTYLLLTNYKNIHDSKIDSLNKDILVLYKKLDLLIRKDFFKKIRLVNFNDIYPTNILLNDPNYKYIYSYYIKSVDNFKKSKKLLCSSLLSLLKDKYKQDLIKEVNYKNRFSFNKDEFNYFLTIDENINILLINKLSKRKVSYIIDFKINYFSLSLAIKYDEIKLNTIKVNNVSELIDVIESLSFNIKSEKNICPICKNVIDGTSCNNCGAQLDYYSKNNSTYAWVFNIFDITFKGDESYD